MYQTKNENIIRLMKVASSNDEVQLLIAENNALLDSLTCSLKTYKKEVKLKPPIHCYAIEGKIHENGFMYCDTINQQRMTFDYENFRSWFFSFYPTKLSGNIDFLGNLYLRVTDIQYCYFGSKYPSSFNCVFTSNKVNVTIDKAEWSFNSQEFITKLIMDPFVGNNDKRNKFMSNRSKLLNYLKDDAPNSK